MHKENQTILVITSYQDMYAELEQRAEENFSNATIEALQKGIKQRDEIIVDLQTEIEHLTDLVDPIDGAFCD